MLKKALFVSGVVSLSILTGCATIMGKGGPQTVSLNSQPDQAEIVIMDESGNKVFQGKTPTTVSLEKKRGFFAGKRYNVKFSKAGYQDQNVTLDTQPGGWYIGGNLLFGGVIGWLVVDPMTGAMWTLSSDKVNASLTEADKKVSANEADMKVVMLDQVPQTLRDKMVKVSK